HPDHGRRGRQLFWVRRRGHATGGLPRRSVRAPGRDELDQPTSPHGSSVGREPHMATEKRNDDPVVELRERLVRPGIPRTSFFTAVRLPQRLSATAPRVGTDASPRDEALEFLHSESMVSAPTELESIEYVEVHRSPEERLEAARHRYRIKVGFLGLHGASTPL